LLCSLLEELCLKQASATTVYVDNQSAIKSSANPSTHARSKHIDIKHRLVLEQVGFGTTKLEYIETVKKRADTSPKLLQVQSTPLTSTSFECSPPKQASNSQGAIPSPKVPRRRVRLFDAQEGLNDGAEVQGKCQIRIPPRLMRSCPFTSSILAS
jgi:hypothetical protein